jgi:hypothetical protein
VVGRIFVQKDHRRSAAGLFEVEANSVPGDCVRHSSFLPIFCRGGLATKGTGAAQLSSSVILGSRASGVAKDEANIGASWFETARSRLLTMTLTS